MNGLIRRALLALGYGSLGILAAWSQNTPSLTLTKQSEIQISVQGAPGATYQLQYASNLNAVTWNPLTNFTMGSGPTTVTDPAAISNQIRFYRALLLNPGNNSSYAPEGLTGGEILQFQIPTGFPNSFAKDHLVVNSSTTGLWVRQSLPLGANPIVAISYQRTGAYSAQLQSIEPASLSQPFARTNFYTLYFTSTGAGFYQLSAGLAPSQTGLFTLNRALIGQQMAAATIVPGQVFKFGETNIAAVSIIIDSATNGVVMRSPGASEFLTQSGLNYQKLGPLTFQLEVSFPGSPLTNRYWGVYLSSTAGIFNELFNSVASAFSRDDTAVGAPLSPLQLDAGEIFRLPVFFADPQTDITRLLVNAATNGLYLTVPPLLAATGISPVELQYAALGPLHAELSVLFPPSVNNPFPQTNRYTFVYTATNAGSYQLTRTTGNQSGNFVRDRALVGQAIASPTLAAGELYSLQAGNSSFVGNAVLIMNSATNGSVSWFPPTSSLDSGVFPAAVQYTRLGPLGARLEIVTTLPGGSPQLLTNVCYLAYLSTNSGFSQGLINPLFSSSGLGSFIRDQTLIGQQITPSQLTAGERYDLVFAGMPGGISNIVTLLVVSPTNALAFWELPSVFSLSGGGLTSVTLNYLTVGPLEAQLAIIFPPSDLYPQGRTNLCSFVYSARDSGVLQVQVVNSPEQASGLFRRNVSLVAQQPAPLQLTAGETYQILTSNQTSTVTETLLLDSPTTGVLFAPGTGPGAGVFPDTTFNYQRSNDFSAQIVAVITPLPPAFEPRTNSYWLIYTATNSGLVKRGSALTEATFGRFQRQPAQ